MSKRTYDVGVAYVVRNRITVTVQAGSEEEAIELACLAVRQPGPAYEDALRAIWDDDGVLTVLPEDSDIEDEHDEDPEEEDDG